MRVYNIDSSIDVVIPVRNVSLSRLQRCIDSLHKSKDLSKLNILVVDYGSKKKIKPKNCEVLRVENEVWNKAHALNLGILKGNSPFVMTVDSDMLFTKEHFDVISSSLDETSFIIDTNVRRIKVKDISKDYKTMVSKSLPWNNNNREQYINQANGGFQVYSRKFFNETGGIMESLGFYAGGMDNYMYFVARMSGLNIIDLGIPLLHQEHKEKKNKRFKLNTEELEKANMYRMFKGKFLDFICEKKLKRNPEKIGMNKPSDDLYQRFLYEYTNREAIFQDAVNKGQSEVQLLGQTFKVEKAKPRILIAIINNYETTPNYFVLDLFHLFNHTRLFYPDVDLQYVSACDVNAMRNLAVGFSLGSNKGDKRYDYLVMLDDDHRYPPDFLIRFVGLAEKNNWDIITGLTSKKIRPYRNTQYHKLISPIDTDENCVKCKKPKDEIIEIEASGPVGMLINTRVFEKMDMPFYNQIYKKNEDGSNYTMGGDLYFCTKLKEIGIPIHLDLKTSFPHGYHVFLDRGKVITRK